MDLPKQHRVAPFQAMFRLAGMWTTGPLSLLQLQGIAVVGVATTSAEAVRRAEEMRPESILVDINLGAVSGFELAEQLYRDGRSAPVILISTHAEQDFADMIAASPAVGFLCKSALSPSAIRDFLGGRDGDAGDHRRGVDAAGVRLIGWADGGLRQKCAALGVAVGWGCGSPAQDTTAVTGSRLATR
jgi:CheY-like chemotaxis protein